MLSLINLSYELCDRIRAFAVRSNYYNTIMPKFDVAIMNPPYKGNLHLKILEKVIPIAEKVVNISPSTWIAKRNINLPKGKYRKIFENKIDDFEFIPHREMNDLFNLGNAIEDGAITIFSNNGTFDVANYGFENEIEKSIYNKINFYDNENCLTMSSAKSRNEFGGTAEDFRNNNIKFYTPIYQWHGGENCYDACVITDKKKIEKGCSYFNFNNEKEKDNFEKSLKIEFMDWLYYNYIVPGDYKIINYFFRMKDYTQPWTNERFCEFFGITDEEWQYMLSHMNK